MTQMQSAAGQQPSAKTRKMEILIGVLVSLVAIAAIVVSRKFPSTGLATDIGSARFPLIYSCALIVLCGILIVRNLKAKHQDTLAGEATDAAAAPRHVKTVLGVVASVASLVLMPILGYPLVTAIYLSFLMGLLGMRHKLLNPLLAVGITALLYFTFSMGLNVPLPIGSLFE